MCSRHRSAAPSVGCVRSALAPRSSLADSPSGHRARAAPRTCRSHIPCARCRESRWQLCGSSRWRDLLDGQGQPCYDISMVTHERRCAGRVRAYQPVRLNRPGQPQVIESLTKDLSTNGLKCLTTTTLPIAAEVIVELGLGAGQEPISLRGQVVWFEERRESEQYDLGVHFVSISPADQRRLSTYIERPARQISAIQV